MIHLLERQPLAVSRLMVNRVGSQEELSLQGFDRLARIFDGDSDVDELIGRGRPTEVPTGWRRRVAFVEHGCVVNRSCRDGVNDHCEQLDIIGYCHIYDFLPLTR